jgi:hypothetical protein
LNVWDRFLALAAVRFVLMTADETREDVPFRSEEFFPGDEPLGVARAWPPNIAARRFAG